MNLGESERALAAFIVLGALACAVACDGEKHPETLAPKARSQAVQATGPAATAVPVTAIAKPEAKAPHTPLCEGQLDKPGKDAPKAPVSRAGNKSALGETMPVGGGGHWTWVNLWAAWCVPCKEEIPRLRSWEAKTAGERVPLQVLFVSMDDDARQLEAFLGAASTAGLHASYWLKDGHERQAWLEQAGMDDEPSLPAHLLVDPKGKVRCKQQGAIVDADFDDLLKIIRGR